MSLWRNLFVVQTALLVACVCAVLIEVGYRPTASLITVLWVIVALMIACVVSGALTWLLLRPVHSLIAQMRNGSSAESPAPLAAHATGEMADIANLYDALVTQLTAERSTAAALVVQGQEQERLRISRELHDQVGQTLTAALLQMKSLEGAVPAGSRESFSTLQETVRSGLQEVRTIASQLRPGVLNELGLHAALTEMCVKMQRDANVRILRRFDTMGEVPSEVELVLFRIGQECLTNVVRHSGASEAVMQLRFREGHYTLDVSDNGNGAAGTEGTGMRGMRERAALVGGTVSVTAQPGSGTTVHVSIPHPSPARHNAQNQQQVVTMPELTAPWWRRWMASAR